MRSLTEQEIETLTLAAEGMMTDTEICTMLEISPDEFSLEMEDHSSQIYGVIMKARLTAEARVRKSIIECAAQGSSPAQSLAMKLIEQEKLNRIA
jgi:hypothetical protein